MKTIWKRRRAEGKTDYNSRLVMLKSNLPRIVFRKTNKYVIGQFVSSKEAVDSVIIGVNSKALIGYGWPKNGSIKNLSACYLTGLLLGKKIEEKFGKKKAIFDLGLYKNVKGGKMYSFLKGVIDSGVDVAAGDVFPEEKRIEGRNLKSPIDFKKIKEKIENE